MASADHRAKAVSDEDVSYLALASERYSGVVFTEDGGALAGKLIHFEHVIIFSDLILLFFRGSLLGRWIVWKAL